MEEKCPCQTDIHSCCACVSMKCHECFKPNQSKFIQGRFCSNCGRPLKAELTRLYVPRSEVESWHRTAELNAQRIMELEAELAKAKTDVADIFAEIEKYIKMLKVYSTNNDIIHGANYAIQCCVLPLLDEIKNKYIGGNDESNNPV